MQEVDEDFTGMSLPGQPDFGETGGDQQFDGLRLHAERNRFVRLYLGGQDVAAVRQAHHVLGGVLESGGGCFAAVDEIMVEGFLTDRDPELRIESCQGAPDMPTRVAQLQQPHIHDVEGGAGDGAGGEAGLLHSHGSGQPPVGYVHAHPPLDEFYFLQELHGFRPFHRFYQ